MDPETMYREMIRMAESAGYCRVDTPGGWWWLKDAPGGAETIGDVIEEILIDHGIDLLSPP